MGKETQSEFIQNMDKTTKSLQQIVTNSWAQGIILLGAETILGEDGKEKNSSIISAIGHSKEIIVALVEFMENPTSKPLFEAAFRKYCYTKDGLNNIHKILDNLKLNKKS